MRSKVRGQRALATTPFAIDDRYNRHLSLFLGTSSQLSLGRELQARYQGIAAHQGIAHSAEKAAEYTAFMGAKRQFYRPTAVPGLWRDNSPSRG